MRHPQVPESLDSWSILHRQYRFDRRAYAALPRERREGIEHEAVALCQSLHDDPAGDVGLAQILGHKADLLVTHYAKSFDGLALAEARFDKLGLCDLLSPTDSYVSVLELGLYEATAGIHEDLGKRELKPHSAEWNAAFDASLAVHAAHPRNAARLWAKIPQRRYVCFYPMNKRRGESVNWYQLPYEDRARLMLDHGKIGRSFHGLVSQVISGSIGFDDWEWGVDLYADDPLVFKKLIYEMRFDEASAAYAEFGAFVTGLQFSVPALPVFLAGDAVPQLSPEPVAARV